MSKPSATPIILLSVALCAFGGCAATSSNFFQEAAQNIAKANAGPPTLQKFKAIKIGMSPEDVTKILGSKGELCVPRPNSEIRA